MLPSNLLRAKITKGKIRPLYAGLDANTLALSERLVGVFRDERGRKKGELLERLREVEEEGTDFKLVRGLSTLLERRCTFEVESQTSPMAARMAVFEEASKERRATTAEERQAVVGKVALKLGLSPEALEKTLYSDLEEELVMREFRPIGADLLVRRYNLSLMQTLLFKSLRFEFTSSGNWKEIFREVKRNGLIYSVEKEEGEGGAAAYLVSVDGPLSLFKFTERYGTSIAKLVPWIASADKWSLKAEILARSKGGRVYSFEEKDAEVREIIATTTDDDEEEEGGKGRAAAGIAAVGKARAFDSSVEERFANSFLASYGSMGWTLRREPEPLVAGRHVLIPDFSFEKKGAKVYLEVVGFWTPEYLERKIAKLNSIAGVDMIVAADESLACSKLQRLKEKARVVYYKKEVPVKQVAEHLREKEGSMTTEEAARIDRGSIAFRGDVVSIEEIAREKAVSREAASLALQGFKPEGYERVGDLFVSREKLSEIDGKLSEVEKLTEALRIIESSGVREDNATKVLDFLGYSSVWEGGVDMEMARISKRPSAGGGAAPKEA